jgi:hypothetical protein
MNIGSNRRLSLNVLNIYQKYKTSYGAVPRAVPPDELIIQYLPRAGVEWGSIPQLGDYIAAVRRTLPRGW